jgi:hypothetical protein
MNPELVICTLDSGAKIALENVKNIDLRMYGEGPKRMRLRAGSALAKRGVYPSWEPRPDCR